MGSRGPIPKRSEAKLGHHKDTTEKAAAGSHLLVIGPEPNPHWHPIAKQWYLSLQESGQARYYEPSDWMTAVLCAEQVSRELDPQKYLGIQQGANGGPIYGAAPIPGSSLAAIRAIMASLLTTEGERRRVELELQRKGDGEAEQQAQILSIVRDEAKDAFGA